MINGNQIAKSGENGSNKTVIIIKITHIRLEANNGLLGNMNTINTHPDHN